MGKGDNGYYHKRLALADSDKQMYSWLVKTMESLGCRVTVDKMG